MSSESNNLLYFSSTLAVLVTATDRPFVVKTVRDRRKLLKSSILRFPAKKTVSENHLVVETQLKTMFLYKK